MDILKDRLHLQLVLVRFSSSERWKQVDELWMFGWRLTMINILRTFTIHLLAHIHQKKKITPCRNRSKNCKGLKTCTGDTIKILQHEFFQVLQQNCTLVVILLMYLYVSYTWVILRRNVYIDQYLYWETFRIWCHWMNSKLVYFDSEKVDQDDVFRWFIKRYHRISS